MNAISKAICHVGSQVELARLISSLSKEEVTPQVIHHWKTRESVPPQFAPFIEQITDGKVKADDVCTKVPWHVIRGKAA